MKLLKEIKYQENERSDYGYVRLWDTSDSANSEDFKMKMVSTIANISYGNLSGVCPTNYLSIYSNLIHQRHDKCFEFIRGALNQNQERVLYDITNSLRNNSGGDFCSDPKEYFNNVHLFQFKVPMFVRAHMFTHRSVSWLEMSRRRVTHNKIPFTFWVPENFTEEEINATTKVPIEIYQRHVVDKQDIIPEEARGCIPVFAFTYFYGMFDTTALHDFYLKRSVTAVQRQTKFVAETMRELILNFKPEISCHI